MKRITAFLLAALILMGPLCSASAYDNPFVSPRGSCDHIDGVTVLIAIFLNDPVHSWDFDDKDDLASYGRIYYRLKTACEWLTAKAKKYGADPTLIWDWYNRDGLYYVYDSDRYLCDQEYTYEDLRSFILANIDLPSIKRKYRADNVIFLAYYNQDIDSRNRGYAWSWDFNEHAGEDYALEIIWITDEDNGLTVSAAGLAHEIMHCFGAVDLYRRSERVPQAYVDRLKAVGSRDIMFSIDYYTPDAIGEIFSGVDAYYMGLRAREGDAVKYGLGYNSFGQ